MMLFQINNVSGVNYEIWTKDVLSLNKTILRIDQKSFIDNTYNLNVTLLRIRLSVTDSTEMIKCLR